MNLKTTLITLLAFCFVTGASAIDDKKKKTTRVTSKSKTESVKKKGDKTKSVTSARKSTASVTKIKKRGNGKNAISARKSSGSTTAVSKARSSKSNKKDVGKLSSKRVSTKSSSKVSVGKEKPLPVKEKDTQNLLTKVKEQ